MLETFFDNPKVFSFFRELLTSEDEKINVIKILFNLHIPAEIAADILKDFVFLGILSESEDFDKTHTFCLNKDSPIVSAILIFDDIIERYTLGKLLNNGEDEFCVGCVTKEKDMSVEEFIEKMENGLI